MKAKKIFALITATTLALTVFSGCSLGGNKEAAVKEESAAAAQSATADNGSTSSEMTVRPSELGVPPQKIFDFPYIGLKLEFTDKMLDMMETREVYISTDEDLDSEEKLKGALLSFCHLTKEQREFGGTEEYLFNGGDFQNSRILQWYNEIESTATIGVYNKAIVDKLDDITKCDTHEKFGESSDGKYAYYLSTNSSGSKTCVEELEKTKITLTEMKPFNAKAILSVFDTPISTDINGVGEFTTEDVFGKTYTQELFAENELTLVNAFATWCGPCVHEMPELEQLRKNYEEKGIKLGVVGFVLDTKENGKVNDTAVETAKQLYERVGVNFPYIIPDDGALNGRLSQINAFPETFFVDSEGNIVGDAYSGARSLEEWTEIVEEEFAKLKGGN